jgi:hypothetical protein
LKKRLLAILLGICLLLVGGFVSASAEGQQESAPSLWVMNVPTTPNTAIAHAYWLINSKFAWEDANMDPNKAVVLGTPFGVATAEGQLLYFPVLQDGKVALTYQLYRNKPWQQWSSVGGVTLVEEINAFTGDTSEQKPMLIYLDENEDIVLQSEHRKQTVQIDPTKQCIIPVDKSYDERLHAYGVTDTGAVSVNILAPAKLVFGGPLFFHTWWLHVTLHPFCMEYGIT